MTTPLKSHYFNLMPAKADLVHRLSTLGLPPLRNIELFKFSSCTPAFRVDLDSTNGNSDVIVLRGEQQNDVLVMTPQERSLEKEIWMLNKIRGLGLSAPKVLFSGHTHTVPGYDQHGNCSRDFLFFLMEYVEGIAIDRQLKSSSAAQRLKLLDRVAEIYARIHSVSGTEYGLIDRAGCVVNGCTDLRDFLVNRTYKLATLLTELMDSGFADALRLFSDTSIQRLCDDIDQSEYTPQPRLVLYDGFCGNMLIEGKTINLIDMAMAGFFEPVTDFCAFIFPINTLLLETANGKPYWDHFLDGYREHGGLLPPNHLMLRLLHVMFVLTLVHQLIYWHEASAQDKRNRVVPLAETIRSMMAREPQTINHFLHMI